MPHKRLLFAEDTESVRQVLAYMLQGQPFAATITEDGQAALTEYRAARELGEPFDLLVLDVVMPKLSGLGVAEAIRATGDTTTPIVLWTAEDSPLVDMRASSCLINEIWPKVSEPGALVQAIERLLAIGETGTGDG